MNTYDPATRITRVGNHMMTDRVAAAQSTSPELRIEVQVQSYLCGCRLHDAGGRFPTACPRHGRLATPIEDTTPLEVDITVSITRTQLTALAAWLRRQTFPYDEAAVHEGAARLMQQSAEEA